MATPKASWLPSTKPAFDWDAITPRCTGCSEKSGALNADDLCPSCVDPRPVPTKQPKAAKPARPRAAAPKRQAARPTGPRAQRSTAKPVDEAAAVQAYRDGDTVPTIAKRYGVWPARIRSVLLRHHVELRDDRATRSGSKPRQHPAELVEQVRRLYVDEQLSQAGVAVRLDLSLKTVTRIMQRAEIPARAGQCGRGDTLGTLRDRLQALGVAAADVRTWAASTDLHCPARGVPPRAVVEAYAAAHPAETREAS